jgi:carbon monoxide dehydrogenase subunit G
MSDRLELEESILIKRSPAEVFDFVTNPSNASRWRVGLLSAKQLSEGELKVGSLIEETVQVLGQKVTSRVEVIGLEPKRSRSIRVKLGPLPIELHEVYETSPEGTRLRVSGSTLLRGPQRLLAKAALGQIRRQLEQELANIKRVLE